MEWAQIRIYRRSIKFLRELYEQKHCLFGLKETQTVQNEESFRLPNIFREEMGRRNYTTVNKQATFHRKGRTTQSVEPKAQKTKLRAMEKFPDFEF